MMNYIIRCLKRQLSFHHIWYLLKLFFAYLGGFYSILKILLLIRDAYKNNPQWNGYANFINSFSGEWLIWELLVILLLTIIYGWKRIKTTYTLKNGNKIIFDYCPLLSQNSDIVIEVPNSFTTNTNNLEKNTNYWDFLANYRSINKSENLFDLIKKNLKDKSFKPIRQINAYKDQERYELGTYCKLYFNDKTYLLAASFKTDNSHKITSFIDDFNVFLCQFWANLSKDPQKPQTLNIPILGSYGKPYGDKLTNEKKIYQILKTYIYNAKKNAPCADMLHICFYNDKENEMDLSKFVTIAKYLDEFRTEEFDDVKPLGTGID